MRCSPHQMLPAPLVVPKTLTRTQFTSVSVTLCLADTLSEYSAEDVEHEIERLANLLRFHAPQLSSVRIFWRYLPLYLVRWFQELVVGQARN